MTGLDIDAVKGYRPHSDSLAGRLCAYFHLNPEESLSVADIVIKYDVPKQSLVRTLQPAVTAGLLKLIRDEYSVGDKPWVPSDLLAARTTPTAKPRRATGGRTTAFYVDLSTLTIEKNVPIPSARSTGPTLDWEVMFLKLQVGDSFVVELAARSSLAKAASIFHKKEAGRIVVRKIWNEDKKVEEIRVWRHA